MAASTSSGTLINVGDTVAITSVAATAVLLEVSGTYTGASVTFEASPDAGTWGGVTGACQGNVAPSGQQVTLPTNGSAVYCIAGLVPGTEVRIRLLAIASGSVSVTMVG